MQLRHQRLACVAQGQADDTAVGRVVTANDEALAYEAVDDGCSGAFAHVELPRQLAHRHRLAAEVGQYAELMSGHGMELVSQLPVQQSAETPLHLRLELAVAVHEHLACRARSGLWSSRARLTPRCIARSSSPVEPAHDEFCNVIWARTVPLLEYSSR